MKKKKNSSVSLDNLLFELSPDPIVVLKDNKVVAASNSFFRMFGYSQSDIDSGLHIMELVLKEDQPIVDQRYKDRISNKQSSPFFDFDAVKKDGSLIRIETSSALIEYEKGPALLTIIRDATERKHMEAALKESEDHFRNISEQSPNMIFINSGGQVVFANHKCEEVMGYTRSEFYAPEFNYIDTVAPEYKAAIINNFKKHQQGIDVPPYEYDLITKRGERINAVITTKLIMHNGRPSILGIITDVTAIKRAHQKLKETTKTLKQQKKELQVKNTALSEILAQIENEKLQFRKQLSHKVEKTLTPIVRKVRVIVPPPHNHYLDILEHNLEKLTEEIGVSSSTGTADLSPKQIEICNFVRSGLHNKEIAKILGVSLRTVEVHRNNIRKRLGLSGRKTNLTSFLQQKH